MREISSELIDKVENYELPESKQRILRGMNISFLVGISGAGKDTIKHRLFEKYGDKLHKIITSTTRQPRENNGVLEVDGVDYHFINFDRSNEMLGSHDYVEANVYGVNIYGTFLSEFEKAKTDDKPAVTDIDVNGVASYKKYAPDSVVPIFILPPSFEEWQHRLLKRYGGEAGIEERDLQKRLKTARDELEFALSVDYFKFLVNDDLDEAVDKVYEIIQGKYQNNEQAKQIAQNILEELEQIT